MSFISFGKIDKNIIPIFMGCIFCFLSRLLFTYDGIILFNHPILTNIFAEFPKIFTFIPFLIAKSRTKIRLDLDKVIKEGKSFSLEVKNNIKRGKWIYIILNSVIYFIGSCIIIYTISIKTNLYVWNLLVTCVFCYFIFNIKLFRHHYLSIIIIILAEITLVLISKNFQNDLANDWFLFLLRLISEIIISLHNIINKYLLDKKFCSIYEIVFYNGVITTSLFGIFAFLDYYFFHSDNFEDYFSNFTNKEIMAILGVMITELGVYLTTLFTNRNYTPCHIFIIYVFGQLAYYVVDFSTNSIVIIICLVFILLMSFIFNEIIEIHCCGLSKNTKRNISERAYTEDSIITKDPTLDEIGKEGYLIELADEKSNEQNFI